MAQHKPRRPRDVPAVYPELHYASISLKEQSDVLTVSKKAQKSGLFFVKEIPCHFSKIIDCLDRFLNSSNNAVPADQKALVRHALLHYRLFVFIVLHIFFPAAPYHRLNDEQCSGLYGRFCREARVRKGAAAELSGTLPLYMFNETCSCLSAWNYQ